MNSKKIKDPTISMEKYEQIRFVQNKLPYERWIEYIDNHKKYYIWFEDTIDGIDLKNRIEEVPLSFREGTLLRLNKQQVLCEFNPKKGWYEIIIDFHRDFGVIHTTFMKKITKEHLKRLLDMANYLDAYLLNNGNEIIDEDFIENYK